MTVVPRNGRPRRGDGVHSSVRYEKKYVLPVDPTDRFSQWLKSHRLCFTEPYEQRTVYNLYFDTLEFDLYRMSVEGDQRRFKLRFRWYESERRDLVSRLEIKHKDGEKSWKEYGETRPVDSYFENTRLELATGLYFPTLLNHYRRRYFESRLTGIRVTIDTHIGSSGVDSSVLKLAGRHEYRSPVDVIEIKASPDQVQSVFDLMRDWRFKSSSHSKYVNGLQAVSGRYGL